MGGRPDSTAESVIAHTNRIEALKSLDADSPTFKEDREALTKEIKKLEEGITPTPLKNKFFKASEWKSNPLESFKSKGAFAWLPLLITLAITLVLFSTGAVLMRESAIHFAAAFVVVFCLAVLAYTLAAQQVIQQYNLEYALWALVVGLIISNTIGTPAWLRPAVRTELYIKTGLVLLGAEVLFNKLLVLGLPGICISWIVTPIVLIGTYLFGQYVLKIPSKSLNMVISADMSVCGVSAAIATAAACRAKKEELSLAIALSLAFTVVMMVVMPWVIKELGMSQVLGGAWMGGTIDSTGAVAAAGAMLGDTALEVATLIKMIQNILIGVIAFGVAIYWVSWVEPSADQKRPGLYEIWRRFPKFALGFMLVSLVFSYLQSQGVLGDSLVKGVVDGWTKNLRGWFFCLAFVSIGLESNFREFRKSLAGGKPLILYVCGQTLNLILTLPWRI